MALLSESASSLSACFWLPLVAYDTMPIFAFTFSPSSSVLTKLVADSCAAESLVSLLYTGLTQPQPQ